MIFSTARLIARRFQPGDLEPFVAMRSDPEVARYQGWGDYTHDHGRLFLAEMAERAPGQAGWFQFALIDKATGRFIGDCGLDIHASDPEQGRIGYTVARPFWNRGLATEAVAALTAYAFANHALGCISASTDPGNAASGRVLEKTGYTLRGRFRDSCWYDGEWGEDLLYLIERARS